MNDLEKESIAYIIHKIKKYTKLRVKGANFGIKLYDNQLYQGYDVKYIDLKRFEFKPFLTKNNTLVCHPSNTLGSCFIEASKNKRMIYGTPFYYKISIGGAISNGAIGGHVKSMNVPSYVKKLWIIDGLGKEHCIEGDELKYFRSTFGYLGIIYKIELETFPEQYFKVNKRSSDKPFNHNTHVSQLVMHNKNIGVINEDKTKDGYEYIDIIFEDDEEKNKTSMIDLKKQNILKSTVFLLDGLLSLSYKSAITGFFDIFIPRNETVVNSYGLVKAFPIIPKITLKHVQISLECGIYFSLENFEKALPIIFNYYKKWYKSKYECINIVIRKVLTNENCYLDMTNKRDNVNEIVCIDFGFYGGKDHQHLLDEAIITLLPYVYGFHLGKYVNHIIIDFAKKIYAGKMKEMKEKYDPNFIFSTYSLDYLFL